MCSGQLQKGLLPFPGGQPNKSKVWDGCADGMLKSRDRKAWRKGDQLEDGFSGPGVKYWVS